MKNKPHKIIQNIKNQKYLGYALLALALVITGATVYSYSNYKPEPVFSKASIASPVGFSLAVRDNFCSDQEGVSGLVTANGSGFATDSNGKDPDCARIFLNPGDTGAVDFKQGIYDQDFRVGIALSESGSNCSKKKGQVMWTPWASMRGGSSLKAIPSEGVKEPDCVWITYETRPLPAGYTITDARVGISTGTGSFAYTPWARQGGGWSEYTPKFNKNSKKKEIFIGPARVVLQAKVSKVRISSGSSYWWN